MARESHEFIRGSVKPVVAGKITPIIGCRGARHSFCQRNSRNRGRNRSCIHILPSFAEVLHTCHKTCGQLNSLYYSSCRSWPMMIHGPHDNPFCLKTIMTPTFLLTNLSKTRLKLDIPVDFKLLPARTQPKNSRQQIPHSSDRD